MRRASSKTAGAAADLEQICRSALQAAYPSFRGSEIHAVFYSYIDLTHTIRRRGPGWILRISDHCRGAPPRVLAAIALILGSKSLRRKPPREALRLYESFREDPAVQEAVRTRRRMRGKKQMGSARGRHHSLGEIYREVNRKYFNDQIDVRRLGWGLRPGWGRLGHYDPVHHTITISPVLDSPEVPRFVLAYLVYHEMLHALFDDPSKRGRRRYHPPEFRRAERAHPDHETAKRFLDRFSRKRGDT